MSDKEEEASARSKATAMAKGLKGVDTSKVEVDDEQVPPTIAADSAEEAAALATMEDLLKAVGDMEAIAADKATKLLCLRGRKYDPARAAELLPDLLALKKEVGFGAPPAEQLQDDVRSVKLISTGAKDGFGRAILWVRLRFHDPKKSKAEDMMRLITTVMLDALSDPDVQRLGLVVINDMRGVGLKNIDPAIPKVIFGKVFSRLPIRLGRVVLFDPPWIMGHVIVPIVLSFMSKKLRSRIVVLNGAKTDTLDTYFEKSMLPPELGGTYALDESRWAESLIASLK